MSTGPLSGPLGVAMETGDLDSTMMVESGDAILAKATGSDTYEAPEIEEPDGFVSLPMGLRDHEQYGTVKDAEVRELTGADEEKISRVLNGDNPWRVGALLLECGVERLGDVHNPDRRMLAALCSGDRDYLLMHIRAMTYGTEVTYDLKCPFCDFEQSVDLDILKDIPLKDVEGQNPFRVELRKGRTATVYLPTGVEDERVLMEQAKNGLTNVETDTILLGECVAEISGDALWMGEASARDLGIRDRAALLKAMVEKQPGPDFDNLTVECTSCSEEFGLPVSLISLFR